MEQQTKVLKLSNGEEIITVITSADKSRPYIEVTNPLQVNLYPKDVRWRSCGKYGVIKMVDCK